jgi:hypothetical protein
VSRNAGLDAAWRELEMDALASDGPIRDSDVKDAIRRNRPHIEEAVMERMRAMRHDFQTLPHAAFPVAWPDWRALQEVLPTYCGCEDCRMWRSGS